MYSIMPRRKNGKSKRRASGRSRLKTVTRRGTYQRGVTQRGRTYVPRGRTYIPSNNRKTLKMISPIATQQILTDISKKGNCRDIKDMFDNGEKVLAEFRRAMNECRRNYSPRECLKLQKTFLPLITVILLSVDRLKKGVPARVW